MFPVSAIQRPPAEVFALWVRESFEEGELVPTPTRSVLIIESASVNDDSASFLYPNAIRPALDLIVACLPSTAALVSLNTNWASVEAMFKSWVGVVVPIPTLVEVSIMRAVPLPNVPLFTLSSSPFPEVP